MAIDFIPNQGIKLTNVGRSLLFKASTLLTDGATLTDKELISLATAIAKYEDAIGSRPPLDYKRIEITPSNVPALPDDASAYKFTTQEALPFWLDGNIRLNPLAFYQTIENEYARDVREGFAFAYLTSPRRHGAWSLMSGFNAFAICTSADARKSERRDRHARFGPRLLRINRANEFADKVASLAGARRFVIRDVTYSDLKIVKGESELPNIILQLNGAGDLKEATLDYLAQHHIDELTQIVEAASAFTKPNSYRIERERRFLFVMDRDLDTWTSVHDPALAEHIEVLL